MLQRAATWLKFIPKSPAFQVCCNVWLEQFSAIRFPKKTPPNPTSTYIWICRQVVILSIVDMTYLPVHGTTVVENLPLSGQPALQRLCLQSLIDSVLRLRCFIALSSGSRKFLVCLARDHHGPSPAVVALPVSVCKVPLWDVLDLNSRGCHQLKTGDTGVPM